MQAFFLKFTVVNLQGNDPPLLKNELHVDMEE